MNGYCRVPRSVEARLKKGNKAKAMGVFLWLLLHARIMEGEVNGVLLRRGQVYVRVKMLATEIGLTYSELRNAINALCVANLITKQVTRQVSNTHTIVTICDFDSYNGAENAGNKPSNKPGNEPSSKHIYEEGIKEEGIQDDEEKGTPPPSSFCFEPGEGEPGSVSRSEGQSMGSPGCEWQGGASHDGSLLIPVHRVADVLRGEAEWAESFRASHQLSSQQMAGLLRAFMRSLQERGTTAKPLGDAKAHFANWYNCRVDTAMRRQADLHQRQEQARQDALRREEERRRDEEAYRLRKQQEHEALKERHLREMRAAAAAGNQHAINAMKQWGIEF